MVKDLSAMLNTYDQYCRDPKTGYYAELELRVDCLGYLCTECQEQLPYHVENVKSNDELYTESEYKEAMMNRINEVAADIHSRIKDLAAKNITDAAVPFPTKHLLTYPFSILGRSYCNQSLPLHHKQSHDSSISRWKVHNNDH